MSVRLLSVLHSLASRGWSEELWADTGLRVRGMLAEIRSRRGQQVVVIQANKTIDKINN